MSRMIGDKDQNAHEICTDLTSDYYRNHTCSRPFTLCPLSLSAYFPAIIQLMLIVCLLLTVVV